MEINKTMKLHRILILGLALSLNFSSHYAAEFTLQLKDTEGDAISNAVVYLLPSDSANLVVPEKEEIVDQINKKFAPEVKVITRGSVVSFPNKDDISHHVYSFSEAKQFELPLYQGQAAEPVKFEQAGVVSLGCNIHDWMKGYVLVVDTPFYALTDENGFAKIDSLPVDQYTANIWHAQHKGDIKTVVVDLENNSKQDLKTTLELKSSIKKRRSPRGRRRSY